MTPRHVFLLQSAVGVLALTGAFVGGRMSVDVPAPEDARPAVASKPRTLAGTPRSSTRESRESCPAGETAGEPRGAFAEARALSPEEAGPGLAAVLANPDAVARMGEYLAFLKTLKTNEARQSALDALMKDFDFRRNGRELTLLLSSWADSDPDAALAAARLQEGRMGQHATNLVLAQWASREPERAIAWAQENGSKLNETADGNWYMASVLGTLAKTDLDRAALLAHTAMNRSQARGQALDQVLDEMFRQRGPEAGKAWVASLPEGTFRAGATERVAARMAETDGPSAASWASSLPPSEDRTRALTAVVEHWAEENPREAGVWLNQLPMDATTDAPRERFVWKVAEEDPAAAVSWAGTITDEKRRSRATVEVVKNWMEREPEKARDWLAASSLPDDIKQRFAKKK